MRNKFEVVLDQGDFQLNGKVVRNYISVGDLESNLPDMVGTWSRSYHDAMEVIR